MARRSRAPEIDSDLLIALPGHPADLVAHVAKELKLSRAAVAARVRALIDAGYISKAGTTRPTYTYGRNRRNIVEHSLKRLAEDRVWETDVAPILQGLPANVIDICHYGLTEMVNNAIDHSNGSLVGVVVDRSDDRIAMMVTDDGVGIFRKITKALDLPDERLALLELAKGKLTTDPKRHTGEGVFFSSRMFDRFKIASDQLVFDHEPSKGDDMLFDMDTSDFPGTTVLMEIDVATARTAAGIFEQYSSGPDDYTFAKTVVPVRLARVGEENLISRSQAKRLLRRVERFQRVVLDFAGVTSVGQAFADEIFRVFANEHPEIQLEVANVSTAAERMIKRALSARQPKLL